MLYLQEIELRRCDISAYQAKLLDAAPPEAIISWVFRTVEKLLSSKVHWNPNEKYETPVSWMQHDATSVAKMYLDRWYQHRFVRKREQPRNVAKEDAPTQKETDKEANSLLLQTVQEMENCSILWIPCLYLATSVCMFEHGRSMQIANIDRIR